MSRKGASAKRATRAEVHRRVVRDGEAVDQVAAEVDVSRRTIYRWLKDRARLEADFHEERRANEAASSRAGVTQAPAPKPKRRRGRPKGKPLIERPDVLDPILELLREGHSVRQAVRAGGVSDATFATWEKKGEAGVEPYASHIAEIEQAKAQGAIRLEGQVMKGDPGWQGSAWLLERTRRKEYGKHDQLTLHHEDELGEVEDDELERLIDEAEAGAG